MKVLLCEDYTERLEPDAWSVAATCESYAGAVGRALRLLDELGGTWLHDPLRGLWERLDGPHQAVTVSASTARRVQLA